MHPKVPNKNKQIFAKISFNRFMPGALLLFEIECDMLTILGESHAIEQYVSQTPSYKKRKPVELVEEFVELEIADKPGVVGPPIDVLQITKTGVVWNQRKQDCQ
jgi:hypothetical protein